MQKRQRTLLLASSLLCQWLLAWPRAAGEVFSSVADMRAAFALERDLVNILDNYASKLQSKLQRIDQYLQEYQTVQEERQRSGSEEEFLDRVVGNPIHAYKMMKRFSVDWAAIDKDLKEDDWPETEFELRRKRLGSVLPKDNDLHGSAQALIRLQDVYELSIQELVKGIVGKGGGAVRTSAELTAQDCLFIGKHCFNSGALSRSLEWFEEAWVMARLNDKGNGTESISEEQVQRFLDHAARVHDEKVMNGEGGPNLFPKPVHEEPPLEQRAKMQQRERESHLTGNWSKRLPDADHKNTDVPRFNALCRGEELRPPEYVAKLKCYLSDQGDSYYLLHPVQIEVAHIDTDVKIFHNVVSKGEMETVRRIASPLLMRSQVQGSQPGNSEVSMTRTSKTGWLQDSFHPIVRKLSERISWMTGLNTDTWKEDAELLQVANYLNGGHYNPHHDYVMKDKSPDHMIYLPHKGIFLGDRIATWMFYMSEVAAGGRTVFPRLGASVEPTAGSAVFWFNLLANGHPDTDTLHGACPVVYGTKWVSNKWIREGAQMFTRPCRLSRDV